MSGSTFGIIGLGTMGRNLALNIEDHGFAVAVWNLETDWTDAFLRDHAGHAFLVAGLANDKLDAGRDRPFEAGRQVVEHDHAFTAFNKRVNHVAADVPGATGDENGHEGISPVLNAK